MQAGSSTQPPPVRKLFVVRAGLAAPLVFRISAWGIRQACPRVAAPHKANVSPEKDTVKTSSLQGLSECEHHLESPAAFFQLPGHARSLIHAASLAAVLLLLPPNVQALAAKDAQLQSNIHARHLLYTAASASSDAMLRALRGLESQLGNAAGAISDTFRSSSSAEAPNTQGSQSQAASEVVQEVWDLVDEYHVDPHGEIFDHARWQALRKQALRSPLATSNAAHAAIRRMLADGVADPYTRFISPQQLDGMRKYDITAVGLNLGTAEELRAKTGLARADSEGSASSQGGVWVIGTMRGSPSTAAGVQQGDEVLEIDMQSVWSSTPFQASLLVQGGDSQPQPPPPVKLKVRRLDGTVTDLSVPRPAAPPYSSPVSSYLDVQGRRKVGHLKLTSFTGRAQQDLAAAISSLEEQGAQELVLDLRNNGGGIINGGVEVAQLFLNDGSTVVITQGARAPPQQMSTHGPRLTGAPLTLLVNRGSASASEIVAGALADNCRAVLVGPGTHGKASVQSVYELSDGSGLVLTVARYLTPSGHNIDREGLHPDFANMPSSEAASARLAACRVPPRTPAAT
ncbi:hypothetical protein WJX74_003090 [Apatococcus lobatus]|uniref:Tail specific protease domain-containing protein n=1 Tax=Apatococcus lobatus TaxID=904363 RepID=A0AAW1RUT9_9CHLO